MSEIICLTYDEEMTKYDSVIEGDKTHHSSLNVSMFKFIYWMKKLTNKENGYLDSLCHDLDCNKTFDLMIALHRFATDSGVDAFIINDNLPTFNKLLIIITLIIEQRYKQIRKHTYIEYDDELDIKHPYYTYVNTDMFETFMGLIDIALYTDK
jgi:hypothetical protein